MIPGMFLGCYLIPTEILRFKILWAAHLHHSTHPAWKVAIKLSEPRLLNPQ